MLLPTLTPPTREALRALVDAQATADLTYDEVGRTWTRLPDGFTPDEREVVVGRGRPDFDRAVGLLRRWTQFDLAWIRPVDRDVPLREGAMFAFAARQLGCWSVNVCRVVRVVDEASPQGARFGFSYGTVGAHAVRGEERFLVTWDAATDVVTFGIRKFSVPAGWLVLVAPLARRVQERFTRDALARFAAAMAP